MDFQEKYILEKPPLAKEKIDAHSSLLLVHKKLLKNIHVCWNSDLLDTLLVSLDLLTNVQDFLSILSTISGGQIFSQENNFRSKEIFATHGYNSSWFDPLKYNSLVEWMVYHFEKVVHLKFRKRIAETAFKMSSSLNILNYEHYRNLQ